jgi:serine/threonine protein kinase
MTIKHAFLDPPMNPDDLGVLGPYRVLNELGRGGMGFVFRAEDTRLKRIVALKVMNEKIAATPHSRGRFVDEARSMAAVKHDNVATIYEVNDQCETPFMAMEMLKGGTLEEMTRRHKKFDYHQVIHYATEMARGLAAAHSQGIIHRDIKPANIWIEADLDRVKILDFGLALVKVPVDQLAGRGSVIGTPQYLSPEQARSEPLDDRTDLYSLGVVLYELCTGELPFKARSVLEQLILTLVYTPPPVSEINPEIPKPLAKLISRLLEKEPRLRPRNAVELEKILDKVAIECEAKSDVALTINKLQEHLSRVVVKNPDPCNAQSDRVASEVPTSPAAQNPFDSLPTPTILDSRTVSPPPPPTLKDTRSSKGSSRPTSFGQPKNTKPKLPKYWPIAAAAGAGVLVLCFIGVILLFSSGVPDRVASTTVISPDSLPAASVIATASPPVANTADANIASPKTMPQSEVPTEQATAVEPYSPVTTSSQPPPTATSSSVPNSGSNANPTATYSSTPSSTYPIQPAPVEPESNRVDNVAVYPPASSTSNVVMPITASDPTPIEQPSTDPTPTDLSPAPAEVLSNGISPDAPVVTIRTSAGKGADTTVKRSGGTGGQLGLNVTVMVQTRGKVDVQHSYLRFDLEALKKDSQTIGKADLVLTLPGGPAPAGSTVRVYGVPEEYPDAWNEAGPQALYWDNSTSKSGLEGLPLLAEISTVGDETTATLRLHDQRLTDFVEKIQEKFVTLVLAGGSPGDKPLHFVSREGNQDEAPSLDLAVQENKTSKQDLRPRSR